MCFLFTYLILPFIHLHFFFLHIECVFFYILIYCSHNINIYMSFYEIMKCFHFTKSDHILLPITYEKLIITSEIRDFLFSVRDFTEINHLFFQKKTDWLVEVPKPGPAPYKSVTLGSVHSPCISHADPKGLSTAKTVAI